MYMPRQFAVHDADRLYDLIERESFGALIIATSDELEISHVPVVLDRERKQLRGHLARANPIWRRFEDAGAATFVVTGPHLYVSPTWYESSGLVPTWNYAVVHARGPIQCIEDAAQLESLLREMTAAFERSAWTFDQLDREVATGLLAAIVGFTLDIHELTGKFKLSQNRAASDRAGVMNALCRRDSDTDRAMLELMRAEPLPVDKR